MKEKFKNGKGITLIALVITIIVLLILAGVTIATLMGDNGILTKATKAQDEQADATVVEAISLAWSEYQIIINDSTGEVTESETKIASTTQVKIPGEEENYLASPTMSFWDFLKDEKGYIDENGVINVEALTGGRLSKGNGTDGVTDVYKIEKEEKIYTLKYYEEETKSESLWGIDTSSIETAEDLYEEDNVANEVLNYKVENGEITITGIDVDISDESYQVKVDGNVIDNIKIPRYMKVEEGILPVTRIEKLGKIYDSTYVSFKELEISDLVTYINPTAMCVMGLLNINVDENNVNYCDVNGVLYNKDMTTLISYPSGKEEANYEVIDTVTEIEEYAFYSSDVQTIKIPDTVSKIGEGAFYCSYSLTTMKLPSSLKVIEKQLFEMCTNLNSIEIPEGVEEIQESAFTSCRNLKQINIPSTVINIVETSFDNVFKYSGIEIINFPNGKNPNLEIPRDQWGADDAEITGVN